MSCFEDVSYYGEWSFAWSFFPVYSLTLFTVYSSYSLEGLHIFDMNDKQELLTE